MNLDAMRVSLADIQTAITLSDSTGTILRERDPADTAEHDADLDKRQPPYIKVMLKKTETVLLYEQRSITALRDSDEGKSVAADNERYAYLTEGKGRSRRTTNAETQTVTMLYKTRDANTETIKRGNVASYVSNFEMFDTYLDLEKSTESVDVDGTKKIEITTYKVGGIDTFIEINENASFKLALMLTMRILAGNIYERQQRRFRNMEMPDPLALEVSYHYRLQLLWRYVPQWMDNVRKAVADMSFCPGNGDIVAVAYGIYSCADGEAATTGSICIWNIKNPVNPERCYYYPVPVVSVEFSPFLPHLLAVGLYDGSVEVLNITHINENSMATSQRNSSFGFEPVVSIKWIQNVKQRSAKEKENSIEPFLALLRNGLVLKYSMVNSPYLVCTQQMLLERVEGSPEGLVLERPVDKLLANRQPQGLNLVLHPQRRDIYFVLTDEGCLHKCSINYTQQHLEVYQIHLAAANAMEFSPWSPKLYLTCGNDCCIHIWMKGILRPIVTLKSSAGPVNCASWSKTHSTIIVSTNCKSIDVWDIRRSTLQPVSSTTFDEEAHTLFKFSNCGRSLAVGNEGGNVLMLAFEDMPFPAFYQYKQLQKAIFKIIEDDKKLTAEVESIGNFGYADEQRK